MTPNTPPNIPLFHIFKVFFLLGLTSFGGPAAHIGFFRDTFVVKRQWLTEQAYSELVALSQVLPGPASSQVGFGLGRIAGGFYGACVAWLGFTLPSAIFMGLAAFALSSGLTDISPSFFELLKLIALVVVLNAVLGMSKALCTTQLLWAIAAAAACISLLLSGLWSQPLIIAIAALAGAVFCVSKNKETQAEIITANTPPSKTQSRMGILALIVAAAAFLLLPSIAYWSDSSLISAIDIIYRSASLVFGGGHVVLPLLHEQLTQTQLLDSDILLAGYSLAQAIPGPIFTLASFIGAAIDTGINPILAASVCLVVAFIPGFVMLWVAQDHLQKLKARTNPRLLGAFAAVNAAVVGILFATLINPILLTSLSSPSAAAIAIGLYVAMFLIKLPVWLVVLISGGIALSI